MIRIKKGDITIECDSAQEAKAVVDSMNYAPHERKVMVQALCKAGKHTPAESDTNHCEGCGTCLHAGMC